MKHFLKLETLLLVFLKSSMITLQNLEVFCQLDPLEKCFKFAMFMEKENPRSFFRYLFRATFIFPL